MIHKLRVGVLRGGPSHEHDISLMTGESVLDVLRDDLVGYYHTHDIYIDKNGNWFLDSMPLELADIGRRVDVVWNALHGPYGEDGKVQHILEVHGIPFTGSGSLASAIGMNKVLTNRMLAEHGIQVPRSESVSVEDIRTRLDHMVQNFYRTLILPVVVKPVRNGSSHGVTMVKWYKDLPGALVKAAQYDDEVMIEDYVKGIEATCAVVDDFRGEEIYALPPVEIRPHTNFFDFDAKYNGKSDEIVPATFAEKYKHAISEMAKKVHEVMDLAHYSRSDFIIHPTRGISFLEVNTLPGLTKESLMPKALRAVGSDLPEFVHHVIQLAQKR